MRPPGPRPSVRQRGQLWAAWVSRSRRVHAFEYVAEDVVRPIGLDLQLRSQRDAVAQCGDGDLAHIVGCHEVATLQHGAGTRRAYDRDSPARAGTHADARRLPGLAGDAYSVIEHHIVNPCALDELLCGDNVITAHHGFHVINVKRVADTLGRDGRHNLLLGFMVWIVDQDLKKEAVKLRLGKRVGALMFHRVLRGHCHEWWLQMRRLTLDGDLVFLHDFE